MLPISCPRGCPASEKAELPHIDAHKGEVRPLLTQNALAEGLFSFCPAESGQQLWCHRPLKVVTPELHMKRIKKRLKKLFEMLGKSWKFMEILPWHEKEWCDWRAKECSESTESSRLSQVREWRCHHGKLQGSAHILPALLCFHGKGL